MNTILRQLIDEITSDKPVFGSSEEAHAYFSNPERIEPASMQLTDFLPLPGAFPLRGVLRHSGSAGSLICKANAQNSAKTLVLGEGMDAVKNAARGLRSKGVNAKWYQAWGKNFATNRPMTPTELATALARNDRWIRQKVKEGYQFYDIGLDPTRSVRSPFYRRELRILKELGVETIPLPR